MTAPGWINLASALPANPTVVDLAEFSAKSFAVVMLSLSMLALFCAALGFGFGKFSSKAAPARKSAAAEDEFTEETLAVIAAAVAAVVTTPHRIVHIRGLTAEELNWTWGGRMQHHASHKDTHRFRR